MYIRDRLAALENIDQLSIWLPVRKPLFYSNSSHIFNDRNKHNRFSGHRAYLCRVEVVIFQAIKNIVF